MPEQIEKLAIAFERFTRRFKVAEAATVMQNSLNALDIQALRFIDEHPKCDLGNVARHLRIVLTTMSSSADRLVRWEMIERTALGQQVSAASRQDRSLVDPLILEQTKPLGAMSLGL